MRTLSALSTVEKNKLTTDSAWIYLLEIQFDTVIRLCSNNEDLSWNSQTWQAFPFELDTIGDTGKGEIPSVIVRVSNVSGEIQQIVEAADGASGIPVIIRVINSESTLSDENELELEFVVDKPDYDELWMTFTLTGSNCLTRRVPRWRYLKNFCRFAVNYGGVECGISAATKITYPDCDGTKEQCTERGNASRYGGFPWMPKL